ncbi:MAG: CoA-binding protein [Deltaproteobacteria bacterium]|nr:CoA-binding protein [Deltaproteobacteria bacterium]
MFEGKLRKLFTPHSVAVIGASENFEKLGYHVMKSLIKGGYKGAVYPVNPNSKTLWGKEAYSSVSNIKGQVDLAIIVVPTERVPKVLEECGKKQVNGAVIITAGYRETEKDEGKLLEDEIRRISERFEIPIIGPNTFGFVNITDCVNASFTYEFSLIKKGGVTLISQSGGFCHLIGFLAIEERVGMAKLMSLGNRVNIDFPEAVKYFLDEDRETRVIVLYIEGIDVPRRLFETIERAKNKKPIIAYKSGRNEKGDAASKFHTGSLAGNYRIWKGAFRQWGILEVQDSEDLIDTAKALDSCEPLMGSRIAVLSGQAGPGIIAADILEKEGLSLSKFSDQTQKKINEILPPLAIRTNPVDMGPAWHSPQRIISLLNVVSEDENTDGILFLNMFASANISLVSELEKTLRDNEPFKKPIIACLNAPSGVWDEEINKIDGEKGFCVIRTPERAARTMANLHRVSRMME